MKAKGKHRSIRLRLVSVFVFTSLVVFIANMYLYTNINRSIRTIDEVYVSNVELNELLDSLEDIQQYVYEYLNIKSSEALENYYRSEQIYRKLINQLSSVITDDEIILMEKNIKNMSDTYLNSVENAVQAKRGRNIERYKVHYENATTVYHYIEAYIHSLNNQLFKHNSNNYEVLVMSLKYLEVLSTVILVVITIFNVILIIILTRSITDPLMKLTEAANEVAAGNFEVDLLPVVSLDEVGIVTKAFNTMTINIHRYIKKVKESMEIESELKEKELLMTNHLKDAQLKNLQAQINPHFLFNTLNAGAQLAMMEEAEKTCVFIEHMADFFRSNMKSFQHDSNLREEIKLVDSYIYILNVRFSGGIHFTKEVDEELLAVKVPSMILQPVVENAVNYGIRDIDYEGQIHLRVIQDEETIILSIKDNGTGMEQSVIDRIMKAKLQIDGVVDKEERVRKDSNGIGLRNVINRLVLYYGKKEIFEIRSAGKNMGTEVIIRIPKKAKNMFVESLEV